MNRRSYRLEEIAHLVKGEYFGEKDFQVFNLASLEQAQNQHICFVNGDKYLSQAEASQAGAYIVTAALKQQLSSKNNFIVVDNPYLAFATLTHIFENKIIQRGISSTAKIHPSAIIADDAYIGHYVVIGENCVVGSNTIIHAHAFIYYYFEIGKDCFIDAHVTITGAAKLKNRIRIHANTVIGGEGFGFALYVMMCLLVQIAALTVVPWMILFWKMVSLLITLCKSRITFKLVNIQPSLQTRQLLEVSELAKTVLSVVAVQLQGI